MELQEVITKIAKERFGLSNLRPYQKLVIQRILEQDGQACDHEGMLVILPTGSGKSVCFMLPSLLVSGLTVIVYPLLSLMNDQVKRFEGRNIPCLCIRGGQTKEQRERVWEKLFKKEATVVITNAECLLNPQVIGHLSRYRISLLVVDEAHTVVQWGMSFRPSYMSLGTVIAHLTADQILAFTATADEGITAKLQSMLFLGKTPHRIRGNSDRENIVYHVHETLSKSHALAILLHNPASRPAIVFCATRRECELAAKDFIHTIRNIPARYYHAGLGIKSRSLLEAWFDSSREGVLFSTNAFGMGVDKPDIRTVIHRTLPTDVTSFLQESGRAGRDGNTAHSHVLLGGEEKGKREGSTITTPLYAIFTSKRNCFRESLLNLMGETLSGCSGCDVCNRSLYDQPDGMKQILSTVKSRPLAYTPGTLSRLLSLRDSHDSRAGILSCWTERELLEAIRSLVERNILGLARYPRKRLYVRRPQYKTKQIYLTENKTHSFSTNN